MYPGSRGGTNWWPATLDPQLDMLFVPVLEQGMVFFPNPGTLPEPASRAFYTAVRALKPSTGELVWEHRFASRTVESQIGGLLSTDGRLVFASDRSRFEALDSQSGRELWSIESGGNVTGPPVTFTVTGEQLVTVAAGSTFLTFALPRS
jgi:alcohol dehydrogenase (cytochrome c)